MPQTLKAIDLLEYWNGPAKRRLFQLSNGCLVCALI
jgi:hypothetical protein